MADNRVTVVDGTACDATGTGGSRPVTCCGWAWWDGPSPISSERSTRVQRTSTDGTRREEDSLQGGTSSREEDAFGAARREKYER